ncbi:hypothetical protein A2971_01460 [Candidatus Gottesmanbacteria bacterium RIFCSPLOWO2_01_FULL_46_21]|uniref:NAD-dependent epimerase/dehydratase domain-containing protein n=1 Tax=Candidatus Gottesmanbacteria bacterium RIFCSPLOWO2_01_FULL_46_21 TaxID=1798393 RepID=A0A1F6AZR5_9BACT|nr:MAG: hypothetical protein A2971_01460 [Candidatus Gottesmanbacteria bacterium RIFCSPLOWO2_01_FULL_46_21]
MNSFWKRKRILVTGAGGFVGSHVVDRLIKTRGVSIKNIRAHGLKNGDLREFPSAQKAVEGIDIVIHLAADVGGIGYSRTHPATQFRSCTLIDLAVFEAAARAHIGKFVAVSSSVAYPKNAPSPLSEDHFFDGPPAETALGYGYAKRGTAILAQVYAKERGLPAVLVIPNNAYGPGQEIDLVKGHVIPSLIYKCLTQKELVVWGDGSEIRDFLYAQDLAEGILLAAERLTNPSPVNIGSGRGMSIRQLVSLIVKLTRFEGNVTFDTTQAKGQKERIVDIAREKSELGFRPKWNVPDGLKKTVTWVKEQTS